jgi:hypothetical protein
MYTLSFLFILGLPIPVKGKDIFDEPLSRMKMLLMNQVEWRLCSSATLNFAPACTEALQTWRCWCCWYQLSVMLQTQETTTLPLHAEDKLCVTRIPQSLHCFDT